MLAKYSLKILLAVVECVGACYSPCHFLVDPEFLDQTRECVSAKEQTGGGPCVS